MDTFCVLPWFGREINFNQKETHCCLLPAKYDVETIKKQMLKGEKPQECQACWNLEAQGLQSDRQLKNSALDLYWNRDLQLIKQQAEHENSSIIMLKLITSYTCNSTCLTCDSFKSSSWSQLDHRINPAIPIRPTKFVDLDLIQKKVNFKELKMLSLIGGEPLYEKKNFELLEHLLELGNDSVFLSMVTNGSVTLTNYQKNILSKFKNINFCVSIDGTGPVFEYLRFPLKWQDLLKNLNFFRDVTDNISANYTLSNVNLLYHNETMEWFSYNQLPFAYNLIDDPFWFQPRALPLHVKQHLENELAPADLVTFFGTQHTDTDKCNWEECLRQLDKQDTAKGIKWQDYLPELFQLTHF